MKKTILAMSVVCLAACDTTVSRKELSAVDYGPRPLHWQNTIREHLKIRLTDPKEAIVEFRAGPQVLYQRATPVREQQWGWGVCVWVNDKNRAGVYDGFYPMSVLIRDEKITAVNGGPDDANIIGARYAREHCEQLGAPFQQR